MLTQESIREIIGLLMRCAAIAEHECFLDEVDYLRAMILLHNAAGLDPSYLWDTLPVRTTTGTDFGVAMSKNAYDDECAQPGRPADLDDICRKFDLAGQAFAVLSVLERRTQKLLAPFPTASSTYCLATPTGNTPGHIRVHVFGSRECHKVRKTISDAVRVDQLGCRASRDESDAENSEQPGTLSHIEIGAESGWVLTLTPVFYA